MSQGWMTALTAGALLLGCSTDPWHPYRQQLAAFLRAASERDSTRLRELATSDEPVRWALEAEARRPSPLPALRGYLSMVGRGEQQAEMTTLVFAAGGSCADKPFIVTFMGPPKTVRIAKLYAECVAAGHPETR